MFPRIIAHRGASLIKPENTLAAFLAALTSGADGIELDLQMTGDQELVVLHDETLDRTTNGKGYLASYSVAHIRELDAGSWFSGEFSHEKVPFLWEVLDLLAGKEVLLNIELKNGIVPYEGMEKRLLGMLEDYPSQEVLISSFNHYSLRTVKQLSPATKCGALYMAGFMEPWEYARRWQFEALHPVYLNIIPELVTGCRASGIELYPWTVDDPLELQRLCSAGVTGIITNAPDRLAEVKGGLAR